ncbi:MULTISPECIES: hypothetical protein [Pasteurellaceae]|uniref:hypothetical protein n=1 Tax=Pasteurellaceae TaxID=712 RepID=UPI0005097B0F|nr:hypothetical protein AUSP0112_00035 [uncultured phage]
MLMKLIDEIVGIIGVIIGFLLLVIGGSVAYSYYPTITTVIGVVFGLGLLSPILLPMLDFLNRGLNKLSAKMTSADEMPQCLQAKNPPLDKIQQRLWRSFKNGYNNAHK